MIKNINSGRGNRCPEPVPAPPPPPTPKSKLTAEIKIADIKELTELVRIGMATIKAFDACRNSVKIKIYDSKIEFSSVEELLEWAEGEEK